MDATPAEAGPRRISAKTGKIIGQNKIVGKPDRDGLQTRYGKLRLASFRDLDGRTAAAQRARRLVASLLLDLGGADRIGAGMQQLVQHAAVLGALIEDQEANWISGKKADLETWLVAVNAQRRLLVTIGLERRAKDVTPAASATASIVKAIRERHADV